MELPLAKLAAGLRAHWVVEVGSRKGEYLTTSKTTRSL